MDLSKIERPKERLIAKLISNKKLSLEQIAEIKKNEVGKTVWAKELGNDLIAYVNSNQSRISNSDYLFPGRDGNISKISNLKISLRTALKKAGMSLSDIGLAKISSKTQFNNIEDVLSFLNK